MSTKRKRARPMRTQHSIDDESLAEELILRLNELLKDEKVRYDISALIQKRIPCSKETVKHPLIQTLYVDDDSPGGTGWDEFGFLGLLNGLVGIEEERGAGYISAEFDDKNELVRFHRTSQRGDA